jgi:translation elongation factor EF-G
MAKQDDYVRYTIRVPRHVYSAIEAAADVANRSANAEIVERLTSAVDSSRPERSQLETRIAEQDKAIEELQRLLEGVSIRAEEWKALWEAQYKNKNDVVGLLRSVCHQILAYGDSVPANLSEFAENMLESLKVEKAD